MTKPSRIVLIAATFVVAISMSFIVTKLLTKQPSSSNGAHRISLSLDSASPSVVAIQKGESVQFDTRDSKNHSIGQGKGTDEIAQQAGSSVHEHLVGGKESGVFGPGQSYLVKFNEVGTFDFHDHLNPKISITVVVYEPAKHS